MLRWFFCRELENAIFWCRRGYFFDESGIDHRLHRLFARAPRGKEVFADIPGARCGRTSIISASMDGGLVEPMLFEGHCNSAVVESYFRDVLLPKIPKRSLIVLDNASFHHAPSTQALVEAAGCELMFLPPYSPDLNPIEHIWATSKRRLQNGLADAQDKEAFIAQNCLVLCA